MRRHVIMKYILMIITVTWMLDISKGFKLHYDREKRSKVVKNETQPSERSVVDVDGEENEDEPKVKGISAIVVIGNRTHRVSGPVVKELLYELQHQQEVSEDDKSKLAEPNNNVMAGSNRDTATSEFPVTQPPSLPSYFNLKRLYAANEVAEINKLLGKPLTDAKALGLIKNLLLDKVHTHLAKTMDQDGQPELVGAVKETPVVHHDVTVASKATLSPTREAKVLDPPSHGFKVYSLGKEQNPSEDTRICRDIDPYDKCQYLKDLGLCKETDRHPVVPHRCQQTCGVCDVPCVGMPCTEEAPKHEKCHDKDASCLIILQEPQGLKYLMRTTPLPLKSTWKSRPPLSDCKQMHTTLHTDNCISMKAIPPTHESVLDADSTIQPIFSDVPTTPTPAPESIGLFDHVHVTPTMHLSSNIPSIHIKQETIWHPSIHPELHPSVSLAIVKPTAHPSSLRLSIAPSILPHFHPSFQPSLHPTNRLDLRPLAVYGDDVPANAGTLINQQGVCKLPLEIGIAIDTSAAVVSHWLPMQNFVKSLIDRFEMNTITRIGLITFDTIAKIPVQLDRYSDGEMLKAHLSKLFADPYGRRRTDSALEIAGAPFFDRGRPGVPKVLFIVEHGRINGGDPSINWQDLLLDPSEKLRSNGVNVFAVGATPIVTPEELKILTGDWSHVVPLQGYGQLQGIVPQLAIKACKLAGIVRRTKERSLH